MIVVVRLGAAITTPGVNAGGASGMVSSRSSQSAGGGVAALFNMFSGGALENCAIFSLGDHALHQRVDHAAVADGGHSAARQAGARRTAAGRRSCSTPAMRRSVCASSRAICWPISFENPEHAIPSSRASWTPSASWECRWCRIRVWSFRIMTVLTLTAGTMFLMWLGDQITDRGIGNGMSLIIYRRHRRAPAGGADPGVAHLRPVRRDRSEPGESDGSGLDDRVPVLVIAAVIASRRRSARSACSTPSAWSAARSMAARRSTCRSR